MGKVKDKITQLSRERIEYEIPELICSEEKISFEVEVGKVYKGSFTIKNKAERNMKGLLYSFSHLLCLEIDSFMGKEIEIGYEFDARDIRTKDTIKGTISIVSSCGEKEIPFEVTVVERYMEGCYGEVKDLFQFANLAKVNWTKAVSLFKSSDFEKILLKKEQEKKLLYQGLLKGTNKEQALEEFLVSIQKKEIPMLTLEQDSFIYQVHKENVSGEIILKKSSWGYLEVDVLADRDFIDLEQKKITQDSFIGDELSLKFQIQNNSLRSGKNLAKIYFKNIYQTLQVTIEIEKIVKQMDRDYDLTKKKFYEIVLVNNYINFRSNRMDIEDYISENRDAIIKLENMEAVRRNLGDIGYTRRLDLYRFHLYTVEGNKEKAEELINSLENELSILKKNTIEDYCAFLYLKGLYTRKKMDIQFALQEIRECYKQNKESWVMLWFLLFLDEKFEQKPEEKIKAIKEQYQLGCRSPILYYEACSVFEQDPTLLKDLEDCTLQCFNMGVKLHMFSVATATQYAYLAEKENKYNKIILSNLMILYEQFAHKQLLTAICSILIKSGRCGGDVFPWYEAAVKEQIALTQLYEYYIYSIDENFKGIMPQEIYMYFSYNTNLPDDRKAFLFANIIKNKSLIEEVYLLYKEQINSFVRGQFQKKHVDKNMIILYMHFLEKNPITEDIAEDLPDVMFKQRIYCENESIVGVVVSHKECVEEIYYPFSRKKEAYVDIFTEGANCFLVDKTGRRYATTISKVREKYINRDQIAETCYEKNHTSAKLTLYIYERIERYHKKNISIVDLQHYVDTNILKPEYRKKWIMNLIQHYYDTYEGEALENLLLEVNLEDMTKSERNLIMEYCIIRGLYDLAYEQILEYSFEGITVKRLRALCSKMIKKQGMEVEDSMLAKMSFYCFKAGKYDKIILEYLVSHYLGTTKDMFLVWKEAREYEIDTLDLEERLLGQILFAESYVKDAMAVFFSFYEKGKNRTLVKAFISYYAYKYLVKDRILDDSFFDILRKELSIEPNKTALYALLKFYSTMDTWTDEQKSFISKEVEGLINQEIVFPFFKKFATGLHLYGYIGNKYYIEYKTNPKHKVILHYFIEDEEMGEEFKEEYMIDVYGGIFVKDFTLFHNEALQYYIEEIPMEGQPIITESITVRGDELYRNEQEDKYGQINMMLVAREMKDEKTLLSLIRNYAKTEYAMHKVFKQL